MPSKLNKQQGRTDRLWFDPDDIELVTDPADPLYHERVHWPVDAGMVESIALDGVIEDVVIRRNGDRVQCVAGRQRVKAAREANKRLKKQGKKPLLVPCTLRKGDDAAMLAIRASENNIREADPPMQRARDAAQMAALGQSHADIAVRYGVTPVVIGRWLKLLDLDKSVQKAVDEGEISADAASKLSALEREKQREKMKELRDEAKKTGKRVTANKVKAKANPSAIVPPKKKEIRATMEELSLTHRDAAWLRWVLGEISKDDLLGELGMVPPNAVGSPTVCLPEVRP